MLAKLLLCNSGATAIECGMIASLIGMVAIGADRQSDKNLTDAFAEFLQQSAVSGPACGARRDLFQRLTECRGPTS